jgi:hypothetical protein
MRCFKIKSVITIIIIKNSSFNNKGYLNPSGTPGSNTSSYSKTAAAKRESITKGDVLTSHFLNML